VNKVCGFPRLQSGPNKGEIVWSLPNHARVLKVLHNPRYAGAFVFGRTRTRRRADGGTDTIRLPREEWQFVLKGAHPGYIDWERFETNLRRLTDNGRAYRSDRRSGPPREGPALLQGRVLCGICGERMGVEYHQRRGDPHGRPNYVCKEHLVRRGGKVCQTVPGKVVDAAIGDLLVELVTPMNLEVTLAVQRELESRATELDAARRQHVERTRYEAELARRRYMNVDPDNRLVANTLEAEWNERLRAHSEAADEYDRRAKEQATALDEEAHRRIRELAEQFPRVWNDPRVPSAERKRIFRLIVEDITLLKGQDDHSECAALWRRDPRPAIDASTVDSRHPRLQSRDRFGSRWSPRPPSRSGDRRYSEQPRRANRGRQALQSKDDRFSPSKSQPVKPP
jgi:hypothetical protein